MTIEPDMREARAISFRCPQLMASALATAAANELCSVSDIARQAIQRDLRARGLITDKEPSR